MEYYGIMPKRKLWVKIGAIIFGLYSIYGSIINNNFLYLPFGVILIIATFSDRRHIISQQGIDIIYTIFRMQFHSLWNWSEIEMVYIVSSALNPNIELHIKKGVMIRKIILLKSDADIVVTDIKKLNPKIFISEKNKK